MDWKDSPEQAAFRGEVRALIHDRLPQRYQDIIARDGAVGQVTGGWQQDRKLAAAGAYAASRALVSTI